MTSLLIVASTLTTAALAGAVGPAPANVDDDGDDEGDDVAFVEIEDGSTYWVGRTLRTYAFDSADLVELYRRGTFVTQKQVRTDADGDHYVEVETEDVGSGEYTLRSEDGRAVSFTLYSQDYSAYFDEFSVENGGDDTTSGITVTSNRPGYTHVVTSPDANATRLQSILGTGTVEDVDPAADDGPELVVNRGSAGTYDRLTANFSGVAAGRFTLNFEVPDTDATASATVRVEEYEPPVPSARFDVAGENVVTDQRGDVVAIPVAVTDTDRATVYLGSRDSNYLVRATVRADFDDRVTLLWNTDAARRTDDPRDAFAVAEFSDDLLSVERIAGTEPFAGDTRIAAGSYPLTVAVGPDENRTDTGVVDLADPDSVPRSIAVRRAPTGVAADDLAVENTDPAATLAKGDALLLRVRAAGLYGRITSREDLASSGTLSLSVTETSVGTNDPTGSIGVDEFSLVRTDPANDAIRFGVDTRIEAFEAGETYEAVFRIDESDPSVEETVTLRTTFRVAERTVSVDSVRDVVRVQSERDQTVSGTSTVADGTPVTVVVRSDGEQPFFRTRRTTVEDGNWSASFDVFSDVPTGQTFTVRVAVAGIPRQSVDGVVAPTASVAVDDQTATEVVTVRHADLPSGGFVAVYRAGSGDAVSPDDLVGTSKYLQFGSHSDVRVVLDDPVSGPSEFVVVAHTDSDGDGVFDYAASNGATDEPYAVDGDPVTDAVSVTVPRTTTATRTATETATATETRTRTATTTETRTATPTDTVTETPTRTTTRTATTTDGGATPGFGIGVGVLAVLATLVALRRRSQG